MSLQEHLQKLVEFYPVSSNQESVARLLSYAQGCFESHGLSVETIDYKGIKNLYVSTKNSKHSKLMLQGHVDVVPATNQPFKLKDGKYFGRGTFDMLFAAASYLHLCDELCDQIHQLDLAFFLSGDEELGGFNGVKDFLEDGYSADVCILPDAGLKFGALNVAAKGMYNCTIRIHGQSHHGSRPWEGDGAAAKLVHFLAEAEKLFDDSSQDNTTMTIAKLQAGDADNQGPAFADAILDIRYKDKQDLARVSSAIKSLLQKYDGEITLLVEGSDYQLDANNPYVKSFIELYKKHFGQEIEQTKAHGSSDARFFAEKNIPVIMLRPDGAGAHGDNEWVSAESTDKFYALLKEYVLQAAK